MSYNSTLVNLTYLDGENDGGWFADDSMQMANVIAMATILVAIFSLSLAGNIFVFLVFYKRPILITISNRFIVNLSICNMLETVFVMPFVFVALVTQDWYFGKIWCQVTGFMMNAVFAASTLTLVVIAIDRYCAVVTPLHYSMRITTRRSALMIFTVWCLAVCCSIPPLFGWNHYEYQRNKSVCTIASTSRKSNDRSFVLVLVTVCFILPLVIMLWTYCCIFKAARNNNEKVRRNSLIPSLLEDVSQTPLRNDSRRGSAAPILVHRLSVSTRSNSLLGKRDEWKAVITSCMVVSTFIICWLLYFIIIILECLLDNPSIITSVVNHVSILLAMSSCAFNPLVYVFRGKVQRVELKTILGLKPKHDYFKHGNACSYNNIRRHSMNPSVSRSSPSISRQGSAESYIIQQLHHVTTTTTLTSMVVMDEPKHRCSTRT